MRSLLFLDHQVFLFINHLPHWWFTDWFALFLSGVGSAGIIWICIGLYFFLREEKKDHRFFIPIVFSLVSCSLLVEGMLKFFFHRLRPNSMDGAYIVGSATWFSFPSSHAAISWAMAVIFSHYEPRARTLWYALALFISLSRVYLGVHYPLDILVGSVIGWGIGSLALQLHLYSHKKKNTPRTVKRASHR